MLATFFALSLAGPAMGEQVGKIPMWSDLGLGRLTDWEDLDFKLAFLMDTYQVVSLEKCLFRGSNDQNTEAVFLNLTSRMHELRPESSTKILFCWSFTLLNCYQSTPGLLQQEDLWLKDSQGFPVLQGPHNLPVWDFRQEEARKHWIEGALYPVTASNGGAGGVFLDGTGWKTLTNCHHKTCGPDQDSCCEISASVEEEFNIGLGEAVTELGHAIHDLDPSNLMIGNGLMNYDFNAGNGNPAYDLFVDKLDGFCMEHLMAFEATNSNAQEPPFIKVDALENLISLRDRLVEVFFKVLLLFLCSLLQRVRCKVVDSG